MAALYIKDRSVAEMVGDLASRLGVTKTEVVRTLAQKKLDEIGPRVEPESVMARYAKWRAENPLPPATGRVADKAFYDSLNDDDLYDDPVR